MPVCQRRAPDVSTDGCEPPYGCWELNSGPLEEQPVLLTSEPSLQPPVGGFGPEGFVEYVRVCCCCYVKAGLHSPFSQG